MDPKTYGGMKWRLVGPFRGGRVLAVTGVPSQPNTYYFGATGGGVWKTTDGGISWDPLFDKEPVSSIGAIAVADSDPNVVYVGTGEACIRGNISFGDGVYKSTDAGKTWANVGLKDTRHIGALIIHPTNPDIVFVAALGHAYGPNTERGVFRTRDGGKTWDKVLYLDDRTGAIDIVFDPQNPHILFAAMWEGWRTPWTLNSGGAKDGLFRSTDDGATWKRLEGEGLPEGPLGRISVSVSGGDSNVVYALIEAKKGGLYRSDDGGAKWSLITDDHRFRQRAWYFTHVWADTKDSNKVYIANTGLYRSIDAGKTFERVNSPHGDNHALWIDPENTNRLINGNDGGATISVDGGKNWSTQNNQPTAQFYHVAADNDFLYRVYGSQQDNSSVKAEPKEPAKLEILDAQGKVVRAFTSEEKKKEEAPEEWERDAPEEHIPGKAGLNLFVWDLRYEPAVKIPQVVYDAGDPIAPLALPGTYQARLTVGGKAQTASFEIKMDPRVKTSAEDLRKQFDLILKMRDRTDEMNKAIIAIRDLRGQLQALEKRLGPTQTAKNDASDPPNPVVTASTDLRKKIGAIEEELIQVNGKSTEDFANYPTKLESKIAYLQNVTDSADTAPTAAEEAVFADLDQRLETQLAKWRDVLSKDVLALNESMRKNNVALIAPAK